MSRSGYNEDGDNWQLIKWRGMVASSIRGSRGQKFFRELLDALDAMPEKVLIVGELQNSEGDVCAIGSLAKSRGLDITSIDPEDPAQVSGAFDIAECLAQEVVYMNDERGQYGETPQARWERMRRWVENKIAAPPSTPNPTESR